MNRFDQSEQAWKELPDRNTEIDVFWLRAKDGTLRDEVIMMLAVGGYPRGGCRVNMGVTV